jgi:putative PIN family toxin of toxin-antitoxin system
MPTPRVVIDTNVLVAGLRKTGGASHRLIMMAHQRKIQPLLSVPLLLEHEEVFNRPGLLPHFSPKEIDTFLSFWCRLAVEQKIHFGWRPFLSDPDDDMLVELALAGHADYLVTSNLRDLQPAVALGIRVVTPGDFVSILAL